MELVHGAHLDNVQRLEIFRRFIYRDTVENKHRCQNFVGIEPTKTDKQWLAEHRFWIRKDGGLSEKHRYCDPITQGEILLHILKTTGV